MEGAGRVDEPLLDISALTLRFGGVQALGDVEIRIPAGSICGVVGPNGAGKTSLFNCICGYYRPTAGTIRALGRDVTGIAPHRLAALGLARTFQHPTLQPDATVLENVLAGGHTRIAGHALSCALRLPRVRRDERVLRDEARALLQRLSLEDVGDTAARSSGAPGSWASAPWSCRTTSRLSSAMRACSRAISSARVP